MTLTRTLWDILDSREGDPSIVDSQDPEVEGAYFQDKRSRLRWRVGITSAIALCGAMVLVVVGSFFWRNATPAVQEIASPAAATAAEVTESPGAAQLVVHVVGAVAKPGVVRVPEQSRVEDALVLAGGPTADAELSGVNLARVLFDGEQIVVPVVGEQPLATSGGGGLVSLSQATQAELESLPRIGPATAERIMAWREANGPFRSVEDLLAVSGIGPATLEGLTGLIVP
jgi:competence protein ComEA